MLNVRTVLTSIFAAFALIAIAGCSAPPSTAPGKPTIVATTSQLQDILQNIVGDRMTVVGLVPRNADPHEFEPTPEDVRAVATAKAVFKNGAGLEGWLDKLIENAGGERPVFETTQGMTLATIDHAFREGGETDPHVWMNPLQMQAVVDNMVAGLAQIDLEGATIYQTNGEAYKGKLRDLDAWAQGQVATIPPSQRLLVTTHDAMGYFASHYGFKIVGYVIPSVSTESGSTSAQQLAKLVDEIKSTGVKTIFAEKSTNPKFMEQVAQDANVTVDELYVDALGGAGGEAGTYLDFIRTDVNKIVKGLK